jgi:peroxiredoxin Q/BCP
MLKAGDRAPTFKLPAADGGTFDLAKSKGRNVIVYFYPRDDTPGCTVEAIEFSRALKDFEGAGATIVGISKDSIASHCKFRDKHKLTIALASDPDLAVHRAYGAWGEKTMYGKKVEGVIRSTFLVGPDGKVAAAWPSVKVAGARREGVGDAARRPRARAPKRPPRRRRRRRRRSRASEEAAAKKAAPK